MKLINTINSILCAAGMIAVFLGFNEAALLLWAWPIGWVFPDFLKEC